jgi:uncharacterized Zn finger protein
MSEQDGKSKRAPRKHGFETGRDHPDAQSPEARTGSRDMPGAKPSRQPDQKPLKRVRFGLKLRSPDNLAGHNEVARQWHQTLSEQVDADGIREGFEYARIGQVINMEIKPGIVTADVQGRRGRPYTVSLRFESIDPKDWSQLIDELACKAAHVAKVLADELPDRFLAMLASVGLQRDREKNDRTGGDALATILGIPRVDCSCGYHRPCKHAAAVGYLLVERLNDEPLLAMTLLGMPAEKVKEQLRQMRVMKTQGAASAHPDQLAAIAFEPHMPLEACVDEFWRFGPQLADLEHTPLPHHVPHALLRRMGPSPLPGRFPMVGLLASIYDTVSKAAIEIRDNAERSEID